jgi:hypothetical protein
MRDGKRRTISGDFERVVEGLSDIREVRPERELVDDVREIHYYRQSSIHARGETLVL